jgi:hypothetical protein
MQFKKNIEHVLSQLSAALLQLKDDEYMQKSKQLNNSTIGGHTRHIIELFQCLLNGYQTGIVNYDSRKRDALIETNKNFASNLLGDICNSINLQNKPMLLQSFLGEDENQTCTIDTNFYREVIYNLEHAIHHMALIRIGINEVSNVRLPDGFGVAPSTIQYKKLCVQ